MKHFIVKHSDRKFIVDANSHKEAVKKLKDSLLVSSKDKVMNLEAHNPEELKRIIQSWKNPDDQLKVKIVYNSNGSYYNVYYYHSTDGYYSIPTGITGTTTEYTLDKARETALRYVNKFFDSKIKDAAKSKYYFVPDDSYGQHGTDIYELLLTKEEAQKIQETRRYNNERGFLTTSYQGALLYTQDSAESLKTVKDKDITINLEGKNYKAVYIGVSNKYPDMADVYIPELAVLNSKYTPADDLGNHPKDGKYYIRKERIHDAEELPHISKEKWNKIPSDYKTKDPVTGKRQAFAGSLDIAPGGTTLLTEGKHFIIDADIEDVKELVRDIMKNDQIRISHYSSNGEITLDSNQLYSTDVEELARVIRQRGHKCDILNTRTVKLRDINSLKDSNTVRDSIREGETYTNKNGVQLKILGINTDVTGKKYATYRIKNDTYNHPVENVENMLKANHYTKDSAIRDSYVVLRKDEAFEESGAKSVARKYNLQVKMDGYKNIFSGKEEDIIRMLYDYFKPQYAGQIELRIKDSSIKDSYIYADLGQDYHKNADDIRKKGLKVSYMGRSNGFGMYGKIEGTRKQLERLQELGYFEDEIIHDAGIKDSKPEPEFAAKGKWEWDEVKGDWYDTGAKMYYEELRRLNGEHLNDASGDKYTFKLDRKKNDYDEYTVKCFKNGKYDEAGTYYTDDYEDALGTLKALAQRSGLTVRQQGSVYIADEDVLKYHRIDGYLGKYDPKGLEDIKKAAKYGIDARLEKGDNGYQLVLHGSEDKIKEFLNKQLRITDALNGKLADLNAREFVEKALKQGSLYTERSDRRGIYEYTITVEPRQRDNSIYVDIVVDKPDERYDADDLRYYNSKQERVLSKKVNTKEEAIKIIEDFKRSVRDNAIKDSAVNDSERYLIRKDSGAGEIVYETNDLQDAIEELRALGKSYYIDDTQKDITIKYSQAIKINNAVNDDIDTQQYFTDARCRDEYFTKREKEDKEFVKNALAEMRRYISNWQFMSLKERNDVGVSLSGLKARVKELENVSLNDNTGTQQYFAGDASSIGDKSVFSEETMNSVQEGIEKDYESMDNRLEELHDSSADKDMLMGYLFSKKYEISQQKAKSRTTGDEIIVYTATNNQIGHGIQFAYNTNTKEIEVILYKDTTGMTKKLNGLSEVKALLRDSKISDSGKCVICGKEIHGYGNNAEPVKKGICCDECNYTKVIPARISNLTDSANSIKATSLDDMISKVKEWNGDNLIIYYVSYSSGYYFKYKVYLGHNKNYFAYIDSELVGRHDNWRVDLTKDEIHESVSTNTKEELIDKVVAILK